MPVINPKDIDQFAAPVPGQSLTAELGSRPWQSPPQFVTVEETINYYTDKFTEPKVSSELVTLMADEIPISVIVDSLMLANVMEGIHTIDVGTLIAPFLVEMCQFLAEEADIEYVTGLEEPEDNSIIDSVAAKNAKAKLEQSVSSDAPKRVTEDMPSEMEQPEQKGLMARGVN